MKTASNSTTNYFDCQLQTAEEKTIRLVCYSPKNRTNLQQAYEKHSPVKIVGTKRNERKRFNTDTEEHTIAKHAKITPATNLQFSFNQSFGNRLLTVKDALAANVYKTIDLKVKIIKKAENKQVVVKNETPRYKADTIVADQTQSIKLILWENIIDKVHAGKCYHI